MWKYKQSTGELFHNNELIAVGWAGQLAGKNNHEMQSVSKTGPLPVGKYTIEKPAFLHPHLGPVVMRLTPAVENEMFGRSAFRIHGSSVYLPELSSQGCIIMPRPIRIMVSESPDNELEVVE